MASDSDGGTYWLALVAKVTGYAILEAEAGYKPCKKPGMYIARKFGDGLRCPGCARRCRIPETSGIAHDDRIVLLKKGAYISPAAQYIGQGCDSCPTTRRN